METVNVKKQNVLEAHKVADKAGKKMLESLFKDLLQNVMDRIKNYEDACIDQGIDPKENLPWKNPVNSDQVYDNTMVELRTIAKSLKGNTKVNWADPTERKWRPWFEFNSKSAGFGFSRSYYVDSSADSGVGSRFCFPTEELSTYFGTQFLDKHNAVLLNE